MHLTGDKSNTGSKNQNGIEDDLRGEKRNNFEIGRRMKKGAS